VRDVDQVPGSVGVLLEDEGEALPVHAIVLGVEATEVVLYRYGAGIDLGAVVGRVADAEELVVVDLRRGGEVVVVDEAVVRLVSSTYE
jgi:hypothetical protein